MTVSPSTAPSLSRVEIASRERRGALLAGVVAGPLFVATAMVQIITRDGFDIRRHPISLLANGSYGWVQSANFVVAGLLSIVFAYAVAPRLRGGRGAVAGPVLLTGYGAGLIMAGLFPPDPAMGFPAGAPAGYPEQLSTSSLIHAFAPPLAFLALVAACLVLARRFAGEGHRGAAVATLGVAVACLLLPVPVGPMLSVRLFVAAALGFGWLTTFALYLRRG